MEKAIPGGCCACHNICLFNSTIVTSLPSGHCSFFPSFDESNPNSHRRRNRQNPLLHQEEVNQQTVPNEHQPQSVIYQIHSKSIHFSNVNQLRFQMVGPREVEVICLECGFLLCVYASKKGAFCKISKYKPCKLTQIDSLPSNFLLSAPDLFSLPISLRNLFQKENDFEDFFPDQSYVSQSVPSDMLVSSQFSMNSDKKFHSGGESKYQMGFFEEEEENEDYNIMFSCQNEPFVGSYTEFDSFLTGRNFAVFTG